MPILAPKTLERIAQEMQADQGARWRILCGKLIPEAEDVYRGKEDPFRFHLGASGIGKSCARAIWYNFRWATKPNFDGRILRLFNRGHLEEPRVMASLMLIGCQIWAADENGKQYKVKGHRGHFGGSTDGVGLGIPDMPDTPMLLEVKTAADKYYKIMVANGVESEKMEHFAQMQIYMGKMGLTHALYIVVNKNTDDYYMEIVPYDQAWHDRYDLRAGMIIDATEPPPKINKSPSWYECKFCDHKPVCHGKELPCKNCRTCSNIQVQDNGEWYCHILDTELDVQSIPRETQLQGCIHYNSNPTFKNKL